ncbi:MAG: LysM peptidoglycan-binding domain-containing protein [Dehalococcoidia bacterium]
MLPDTPHPVATRSIWRCGLLAALVVLAALPITLVYARTHTVEEGDTLSAIADAYGLSLEELAAANGISNPDFIYVGQELIIGDGGPAGAPPDARVHIVAAGETLSSIADGYGFSLEELLQLNGIFDANYIYEGQELSLPVSHYAPPPVSRAETEQILRGAADEFGVDPSIILGLAWLESGWNQSMTSHVGAVGVMQLMEPTAEWALEYLAPDATNWRTSTADNVRLGTAVFANLLVQANWDVELALAFYYQGWRSIEINGMFDDTYQYIENVLSLAQEFR